LYTPREGARWPAPEPPRLEAEDAPGTGHRRHRLAGKTPALNTSRWRDGGPPASGRIVEVAPDGSAIVVEELVTWSGPGTGVVIRSIRLTPRTAIRVIQRSGDEDGDRTAMPGWDARVIDAAGLRPGDFVTITTNDDRRTVAVALLVVHPTPE
jgi:hypothetical protein